MRRQPSEKDRRAVTLTITPRGELVLRDLTLTHRSELRSAAPSLLQALTQLVGDDTEEQP